MLIAKNLMMVDEGVARRPRSSISNMGIEPPGGREKAESELSLARRPLCETPPTASVRSVPRGAEPARQL